MKPNSMLTVYWVVGFFFTMKKAKINFINTVKKLKLGVRQTRAPGNTEQGTGT